MGMKIDGIDELFKDLDRLSNIEKEKIIEKAVDKLLKEMKENAPYKDGHLQNSIKAKIKGNTGLVYSPLAYAWMLEYGTKYVKQHIGWWSGTVEDLEGEILRILEEEVIKRGFK